MTIDKFKKYNWVFFLIIIIASFLRLWKLGTIPPGLTSDEASLGYNAYSILKTGRDEYGQILPIVFKSFGDYKPGLYVYLTIPFVAVFGLNEWAVRLPSALSGVLAVWLIYKIVTLTVNSKWLIVDKKKELTFNYQSLGVISAFTAATNPWLIYFSRGAWEANISLTLTLAGIYFFLQSLRYINYLILSAILFALTFLTYQGSKLSSAIVIFVLVVVFWKEVKERLFTKKIVLLKSIFIALIILFPIILSSIQGELGRLEVFSVFSYPRKVQDLQKILNQGNENFGGLNYYLFHSESLNFFRGIAGRWFNHFSGRFLFFEGDYQNPRHSAPNQGMLLLSDLFLITYGFVALLKIKDKKFQTFTLLWLILTPLPAVLSRDQVHAVRALNMVMPLIIISSVGLIHIILWIKNIKYSKFFRTTSYLLLTTIYLASFIYFFDSYFIHLPKHNSKYWEYGYKEIVRTITPIQGKYETIKVQQSFAQPYIYFLFYQKYNPSEYQKQAKLVASEYKFDVGYVEKLDNIYFWHINWPEDKKHANTIVVADPIAVPKEELLVNKNIDLIKEIKYLDGNTAYWVLGIR